MFWNKECLSGFPLKFPLQEHGHKSQTFTNTTVAAFFGSGHPTGPAWSMTSPSRRLCSSAAAAFRLRWQRWTRSTCQGHSGCQREVAPLCLDLIPIWIRLKKTRRFDFYIVIFWYCLIYFGSFPASNTIFTARAATSARNCAWHIQNLVQCVEKTHLSRLA